MSEDNDKVAGDGQRENEGGEDEEESTEEEEEEEEEEYEEVLALKKGEELEYQRPESVDCE